MVMLLEFDIVIVGLQVHFITSVSNSTREMVTLVAFCIWMQKLDTIPEMTLPLGKYLSLHLYESVIPINNSKAANRTRFHI